MSAKRDLDFVGKSSETQGSCDPFRPLPGPRSEISPDWIGRGLLWLMVMLSSAVLAQPQAPITWGEARWFAVPSPGGSAVCAPLGDTVLAVHGNDVFRPITSAVSFDDGNTFSNWVQVDSTSLPLSLRCTAMSSGRAFMFFSGSFDVWMRTSSDAGQSWSPLQTFCQGGPNAATASDQTVVLVNDGIGSGGQIVAQVSVSTDLGSTWGTYLRTVSTTQLGFGVNAIAITRSRILLLGSNGPSTDSLTFYIARGNRSTQVWQPFQVLADEPQGDLWGVGIGGDTTSETAMIVDLRQTGNAKKLWVHRTTDGGDTWQAPVCLDSAAGFADFDPYLIHRGSLWATVWKDVPNTDTTGRGMYCLFSANDGENWYPSHRIESSAGWNVFTSFGQFINDELRVYWSGSNDTNLYRFDIHEVRGIIRQDTVAPMIQNGVPLPDEVQPGSTVHFLATASDNDSLPYMQVVLKRSVSEDSIVVSLSERVTPTDFRGTWTVPSDTALWHYYYRAEDMWENVTVFPDTGTFSFHTTGWSKASDLILHSSSFILSVYPNPSNGWPSLQLSPEWFAQGPVTVAVYNLLGQKVAEERMTSARADMASHVPTAEVASGIYFLSVRNVEKTHRQKFLILK